MYPAPSVLVFTVLSGLGFGTMVFLGAFVHLSGASAFLMWGLAYALAVAGLLASTFHLGHPERAWRAFSQWRSSWLSREGIAAVATLLVLAPVALSDWLQLGLPAWFGLFGAGLALVTIGTTSMIYAQLKTVPRWNHWTTPAQFFAFALGGGALASGQGLAPVLLALLALALLAHWHYGDRRFAEVGADMGSATGLGALGKVSVFDPAHTAGSYVMREMIFVVGRKHVAKLRGLALVLACLIPGLVALLPTHPAMTALAVLCHLTGAFAARWLFFAQAEHVVGLYYGKRQ
jgi:DMSO reductase anchor subunit